MTMGRFIGRLTLILPSLALASAAFAQGNRVVDVPSSLNSARRAPLQLERERIRTIAVALQAKIDRLAGPCSDVEAGTPLDKECAGLADEQSAYRLRVASFQQTVIRALDEQIADHRKAIVGDQAAIRQLRFDTTSGQLEDWVNLAQSASSERDQQIKEALRESAEAVVSFAATEALGRLSQGAASLNPPKFYTLRGQLRAAGIDNPELETLLQAIANTPGKPEKLRKARELIALLKREKAIWDLSDLTSGSESAKWKAGSSILTLFVPDPRLKLLGKLTLQEVRVVYYTTNSAIVGRLSLAQIDRLATLTDQQLGSLRLLSAKIERDVKALRAAIAEKNRIEKQ